MFKREKAPRLPAGLSFCAAAAGGDARGTHKHLAESENLRLIHSSLTALHGRTGPQPQGD
jgi:hypothetical protein